MTAIMYLSRTDIPLDCELMWGREIVGVVFLSNNGANRQAYLLPKEQASTFLDIIKFVTKHNLENYEVIIKRR